MKFSLYIVLQTVLASFLHAQITSMTPQKLPLEDGVSSNAVFAIHQDQKGLMWFGTLHGLVKYDGYRYTTYRHDPADPNSLSHDDIVCIDEDDDGCLWIGTYGGGINRFDPKKDIFVRYFPNSNAAETIVWDIEKDVEGNVWFATQGNGIFILPSSSKHDPNPVFIRCLEDSVYAIKWPSVRMLRCGSDGMMWIGSFENGLGKWDANLKKFTSYLPANSEKLSVIALFEENKNLLIGTGKGFFRFDPMTENWEKLFPEIFGSQRILNIVKDREDILWIGTAEGLWLLERGKAPVIYKQFQNPSKPVVTILEDRSGLLWFSLYYDGVYTFSRYTNKFLSIKNDPIAGDPAVNCVMEDRSGNVWMGTKQGLNRWNSQKSVIELFARGKDLDVTSISESERHFWIGTRSQGLFEFDPNSKRWREFSSNSKFRNTEITVLSEDHAGNLWIGTDGLGVFKLDKQTNQLSEILHSAGPIPALMRSVKVIYKDRKHRMWIGTLAGLLRCENDSIKLFSHRTNDVTGLNNPYVYSVLEDTDGELWVGTAGGLNRFNSATGQFIAYREKDGLPNGVICGILEDRDRQLWISTHQGITRFNKNTQIFRNYDIADGLQSNLFSPGVYFKSHSGKLYFGGILGVNVVLPEKIMDNPFQPEIEITAVKKFGRYPARIQHNELILNYNENFITIDFSALDFTAPEKNHYAYQLSGVDPDWVYAKTAEAVYTGLAPGEYLFRVKGTNHDGIWSAYERTLKIIVTPPFWKTTWFYIVCAMVFAVTLIALHRQIVRQRLREETLRVEERERVRKQVSQDFHDELGHKLTKINLFGELIRRKMNGHDTEMASHLGKVTDAASSLSANTRDFIWVLDPQKDTLLDLIVNLRDFGYDLFDASPVKFGVKGISENLAAVKLSMDWRRHATLIFKEGMNNILKHAHANHAELAIELRSRDFIIYLSDNGKGLDDKAKNGYGLSNMRQRAGKIDAQFNIESSEHGTRLSLIGSRYQSPVTPGSAKRSRWDIVASIKGLFA